MASAQTKKGVRYKYKVQWHDGDETWVEVGDMVDQVQGGEPVIDAALKAYWKERPELRGSTPGL